MVPQNLALKHRYDDHLVFVDPRAVGHLIQVGVKRPRSSKWARSGALSDALDFLRYGGGWKSVKRHPSRNLHGVFVADGDWDLRRDPFDVLPIVREVLSPEGSIEDTEHYRKMQRKVASRDLRWTKGIRSEADLESHFRELVRVVEAIRDEGFMTQAELGNPESDEIRVCIDREGNLCVFGGGTHRLSAAKLLGLEAVPVHLKRVHAAWAQRCVDRFGGPLPKAIEAGLVEYQVSMEGAGG